MLRFPIGDRDCAKLMCLRMSMSRMSQRIDIDYQTSCLIDASMHFQNLLR